MMSTIRMRYEFGDDPYPPSNLITRLERDRGLLSTGLVVPVPMGNRVDTPR